MVRLSVILVQRDIVMIKETNGSYTTVVWINIFSVIERYCFITRVKHQKEYIFGDKSRFKCCHILPHLI